MSDSTPPEHTTAKELPPGYFRPHDERARHPILDVVAYYQGASYLFSRKGFGQPWVHTS
jgi:hypothetical protein